MDRTPLEEWHWENQMKPNVQVMEVLKAMKDSQTGHGRHKQRTMDIR